jgi:hypothetical protein
LVIDLVCSFLLLVGRVETNIEQKLAIFDKMRFLCLAGKVLSKQIGRTTESALGSERRLAKKGLTVHLAFFVMGEVQFLIVETNDRILYVTAWRVVFVSRVYHVYLDLVLTHLLENSISLGELRGIRR